MKWEKLGLIFDPTTVTLANNCHEYAQAPQALVFDDFVRIYFSSREKDESGKFLSHIAYVEFEKDLKTQRYVSENTVIPLGDLGCFDQHGIFPLNVVRFDDQVYGYISGISRRVSVPIDTAIGVAVSSDQGKTFKRLGDGPILGASLHEPYVIGDPFVLKIDDKFHMFYLFANKWLNAAETDGAPARVYKIAHATSDDGINWQRNSIPIISDMLGENECQALPTVACFDGKYHMFFCYRAAIDFRTNSKNAYRIGYAWSENLDKWHRADSIGGVDVSEDGWDSEMICYPHIFSMDDDWYLLYNGNQFGKYGFGAAKLCRGT